MNLRQINELWNEYKEKYDLPKDVQISAVQYDAGFLTFQSFLTASTFCI